MFKIFQSFKQLKYGLSQKSDGPIGVASQNNALRKNYNEFLKNRGLNPSLAVSALQAHSHNVSKVGDREAGMVINNTDGLVTSLANLLLTITVADCFPVYFFDPVKNILALAHDGWRGVADNLIANVLKKMGSDPRQVLVGIGPGIQACHFEIKEDVLHKFEKYPGVASYSGGAIFVDLPKMISHELTGAGVLAQNIENFGECTYCHSDKYFSFRRDKPASIEAMLAYIGLTS